MFSVKTTLASLCVLVAAGACSSPTSEPARGTPSQVTTSRRALGEGPASLMADLGQKDEGALVRYPANLVAAGTTLLFSATNDTTGTELWKLTPSGPLLVADIAPGPLGSAPSNFFHLRGLTYFTATDGEHGLELWRTDGTASGTFQLADLQPGAASSRPQRFVEYDGWLFFAADDGVNGTELWRTDGTPEGTVLVRDILLGKGGSVPTAFTVFGGKLYFVATGSGGTQQLWRTDGTQGGTVRVSSKVTVGASGGLVRLRQALFFVGNDGTSGNEPWKTDGTEAGTVRVKDLQPGTPGSEPQRLTAFGDALYFAATNGVTGRELWRTDGTEAGTLQVGELVAGNNTTTTPDRLIATTTHLFFTLGEGSSVASPLYATDGTAAGTVKVLDPLTGGRGPASLTASGGTLYFTAYEPDVGYELWTSDGSPTGTRRIGTDLFPGNRTTDPAPNTFTVMGDTVYFVANAPGTGLTDEYPAIPTLWRTRGDVSSTTPDGTEPKPTRGSHPGPFASMGGALYFTTFEEDERPGLWRSNGTTAGTQRLRHVGPKGLTPVGSSGLSQLTVLNERLYFADWSSTTNPVLLHTGGTAGDAVRVGASVTLSTQASHPIELPVHGGLLFFAGEDATRGIELWRTDGSEEGTVLVKDLRPGTSSSKPAWFTSVGGDLYFVISDSAIGRELWKTDGSEGGTVLVADIDNLAGFGSVMKIAGVLDGTVYFVADGATTGTELWRVDGGAPEGAVLVKDLRPGSAGSGPSTFAVVDGVLYFTADEGVSGRELWRTDGTESGTWRVMDIAPGARGSDPATFTVSGTTLYFTADDGVSGRELWRTDGTSTSRVADIRPGSDNGVLAESLFVLPNEQVVLFAANDGRQGTELWRSDGTEAGTFVLHDIAPGQLGSYPGSFFVFGDAVLFTANNGRHGREPWRMPRELLTNTTPPTLTSCPASTAYEAQQALGARVDFPEAEATDDTALPPALTYSHEPGGFFPFGDTPVTVTARDAAGLVATCRFTVTVRDTTPPEPVCPGSATVEATSEHGARVSFPNPVASDTVTRAPTLSVDPASGGLFTQGETLVTVTARDEAGNSNQCTFTVHVRDTTASVLTCPANQLVEAMDSTGASVSWPSAVATDVASRPTVTYDPLRGSRFPLGSTPVTVTATDGANNVSRCTFQVLVRDTTAPTLHCRATVQVEATGPSGAPADFLSGTSVMDTVSPVSLHTSHAPGDTFPLGESSVVVRATDASGNTARCDISVTVRDTLPPRLMCPPGVNVVPGNKGPVAVELPQVTATDRVTGSPTVTMSPQSGSLFEPGDTTVEVTAMDAAGNTARCSFNVHVEQAGGCSSAPGNAGAAGWAGLLWLLALAVRRGSRPFFSRGSR